MSGQADNKALKTSQPDISLLSKNRGGRKSHEAIIPNIQMFLGEKMVLARPKDNKALKSSQSDISLLSKNIGRKEKQIDCEAMISNKKN